MTIEEFFKSPEKIYVHVPTQEICTLICKALDDYLKDNPEYSNGSYQNRIDTHFNDYGNQTAVSNKTSYCSIDFAKKFNNKILKVNFI